MENKEYMLIDGNPVEINGEKNLLEVIRKAGIELPTFCYHSELSVYGACRMCMVENSHGGMEAACSTVPKAGMEIYTNTERLHKHRKMILELLLANHCRDCTTCQKNGKCRLQELASLFGLESIRFKNLKPEPELDTSSLSIIRDAHKCILCGDCVRMCNEIQNVGAIDFVNRGSKMVIGPAFNEPIANSPCVGCGQCAAVCPTGAIVIRKDTGRVWPELNDKNTKVVAEALRELSGRLEEMPAEEGFPAYLASKLSAFSERAGMMQNLNGTEGSVSIIGAVSPQGGDFSEPVTQNTKRFVRCFWGLDKSLAYARHFPAIHWLTSYSEYLEDLTPWYRTHVSPKFVADRNQLMAILNQESSLMEIVKLIGSDVLPDDQKLTLEIARVIRLGFLQQNAFHQEDTCVPMEKQFQMMETILYLYEKSKALINRGMPVSVLKEDNIFERIISIKYDVPNNELDRFEQYRQDIDTFYNKVLEKNG